MNKTYVVKTHAPSGVWEEQKPSMTEAIQFYRRQEQLFPHIRLELQVVETVMVKFPRGELNISR